ncbi:MAG: methylated-DNA--[Oscillospiraceae bacterium]|nr:methylated-DNA--[protein]-cysteine S-methyltransferase [Oscillospiraceae bacterium]
MDFYQFATPVGDMAVASEDGCTLSRLWLPGIPLPRLMPHPTPLLLQTEQQVLEYLACKRHTFDLPLCPQGTPFQLRVWAELCRIPWGQTRSYGQIARAVCCPKGFRAVGQANHANPIPILIPCHRVIAADGSPGGYAGDTQLKTVLLGLEGISF